MIRSLAKLVFVIVDKGVKQRFTSQKQVVALPFVSSAGLVGGYRRIKPILTVAGVLMLTGAFLLVQKEMKNL